MSASKAIRDIITLLQTIPAAVISQDRIARSDPAAAADLPLIAVSLGPVKTNSIGIGGLVVLAFDGAQWNTTTGTRLAGRLQIEIWAADAAKMAQLTDAVLTLLANSTAALNSSGFVMFETESIRPVQAATLPDTSVALHTTLEFSVTHEDIGMSESTASSTKQ